MNRSLTTLMSWMSWSPTVTTTGSLKWWTGRTTLLYPVNRFWNSRVSSEEAQAGPAVTTHSAVCYAIGLLQTAVGSSPLRERVCSCFLLLLVLFKLEVCRLGLGCRCFMFVRWVRLGLNASCERYRKSHIMYSRYNAVCVLKFTSIFKSGVKKNICFCIEFQRGIIYYMVRALCYVATWQG